MAIYTDHAAHRMQQRGIPDLAVALLTRYGKRQHATDGASVRYFDKRSWARAERAILELAQNIDRVRDMYFIENEESVVVTTGHRTERVKLDYRPGRKVGHR